MPEEELQSNLGETVKKVLNVVVRQRWWVIAAAFLTPLVTIAYLWFIPNRYRSEATLLVVQQQVPLRYVVPNSTTDITSELQAMKQEVLSRPKLEDIVEKFGLYPKLKTKAPEQVMDAILRDIDITPLESAPTRKDFDAFRITFTADDPAIAQKVTTTLTSLFISENLKSREAQAANTTKFLHEQLEVAKAKLAEQEERLRDFKTQHLGELPEQQPGNLGILTSLQTQLQNTMATMSRAQEQRVYLEALMSGYQKRASVETPAGPPEARVFASPVDAAQFEVRRLETERAKLLIHFTPRYPAVMRIDAEIVSAKANLEHVKASNPKVETAEAKTDAKSEPVPAPVSAADQTAVAQLRGQLNANRLEMDNLAKEEAQIKDRLSQYENKLNQIPVREQQLTSITREYDLQKQNYSDLLGKELQSNLATNLEREQAGQQFRLVDPPSLPVRPFSPKRSKINTSALGAGIAIGLVIAFLMELRDRSFYDEKQLIRTFGVPLVVSIPLFLTPAETRRVRWRQSLEWLAGFAMVLIVCAAELISLRRG